MFDEAFKRLDPYTLRARLLPALLTELPIALSLVARFPDRLKTLGITLGISCLFGATILLSQAARDCGKRQKAGLFKAWGGTPTVALLRHRDNHLNPETKDRYHRQLQRIISGLTLPTGESEAADPVAADLTYASYSDFLRERTCDTETFGLLLSENVNYGTRRNILGLKPCAILLAVFGVVACAAATLHAYLIQTAPVIPVVSVVVTILCLVWWSFRVNKPWVKTTAFAYAERLLPHRA
jgi:hypothetical protein